MAGAKSQVNHWLLFVRMAILVSQKTKTNMFGVLSLQKEKGQCESRMSADKNLRVVVA